MVRLIFFFMGVCLAENSLMMVMENWAKSKRRLGFLGFRISDFGFREPGLGSPAWALRSGADFPRSEWFLAVPSGRFAFYANRGRSGFRISDFGGYGLGALVG